MSKVAAAIVLIVFAVGAVRWFVPSLTLQRSVVVSTPSLDGISVRNEIKLRRGQTACIKPVPLDPEVRQVRLILHALGSRPSPLALTVTGPGYRAHGRFAGYPTKTQVPAFATLDRAPPSAADGQLCMRNTGRRAVSLVGTSEPESQTVPVTYVDGKPVPTIDPAIAFLAGENRSILQRSGTTLDRAADFTDAVPDWLMWPLALLFFLGMPLGAASVLLLSARRD
jgi:hypothetical protein